MAKSQANLNPKKQAELFALLKESGQQPISGGMPVATPDEQAVQGVGNVGANELGGLFNSAPQAQPQQLPAGLAAPGSFKDDPQGAIAHIAKVLQAGPPGSGYYQTTEPADDPIGKLFGMKNTFKVPAINYYDTLTNVLGKDATDALIPGDTPLTPEGKPLVSEKMLDNLKSFVKLPTGDTANKPNKALGKLALGIVERRYGKDSPEFANAQEYLNESGGLPLGKLGEWNSATLPTKENDFVKSPEGLMLRYNRPTQSYEPVPGQTTGVMSVLNNPANLAVFNSSRQRFDMDPVVKTTKASLDLLGNASSILESDNPAAIGVLFSNIAKSVGKEAGVLTESDIARAVGDPGWGAQLYRWYNKRTDFINGKGQLSERDLKDFRGLFRDISSAAYSRYSASLDKHVKTTAKVLPGISEEFIKGAFDTAVPFMEAPQRRLKGEATNYPSKAPKADNVANKFGF